MGSSEFLRIKNSFYIVITFVLLLFSCSGSSDQPDLLIVNARVVSMDSDSAFYDPGFIAVKEGKISAIGKMENLEKNPVPAKSKFDAKGKVVLPGLINTHTHLAMTLLRGIADDLELNEWLTNYIFPAEAKNVNKEYVSVGTQLGLIELVRGGTTTYTDMYYFEDIVAEETKKAGVRAVLGETVLDFPAPDNKTWEEAISYVETFLEKWKNDSLITPAIAPHAIYTVSTDHLQEVLALSKKYDAPILTHLAEAPSETKYSVSNYKKRPVPYLDSFGFLNPKLTAAHVVHVNQSEIDLIAKRGVGVAHCPQSNMKLSSGVAPIPAMIRANLRLGLGTDGAASNNDLSLWEEIDTAAKLHKLIQSDPTVVTAKEALELATIGGARAIHMEDKIGSLEPGKFADLIFIDMNKPHLTPSYNIYSSLAYTVKSSDVTDVIIAGKWILKDQKFTELNEEEILKKARTIQKAIEKSLE